MQNETSTSHKNIIDKIWESHCVKQEKNTPDILFLDLQLLHEVTSPQAFAELEKNNIDLFDASRQIATVDHSIPTNEKRDNFVDEKNRIQIEELRKNCKKFGVKLYDVDSGNQGIVHVAGPELGLTQPGMTICCGDSHTSTHGAFGALAFGVGTTQISHVMAASSLLLDKPKTMKVNFVGTPSEYFTAKDAILALIRQIGVQGGTGYAMEYCGEFITKCSMEERMTMCNMSIECGARSGVISPDEKTYNWIQNTGVFTKYENSEEKFAEAVKYWNTYISDENAEYDTVITVDITDMKPLVTWGTTPGQSVCVNEKIPNFEEMPEENRSLAKKSLEYTELEAGSFIKNTPIDYVFIGSCTNGRVSDFEAAAKILEGKKVKEGVIMFVVPGSEKVEAELKEKGIHTNFKEAGADFRRPGCSMCLAMNGDTVPAGKRAVSTSNRNFIGRQGVNSITHLVSPEMATIAAITGKITDPEEYFAY